MKSLNPLLLKALPLILSAAGGWAFAQYPVHYLAFCSGGAGLVQ